MSRNCCRHSARKEISVSKVRQIPLSDSTTKRRCDRISDLLNQLLDKLKKAHSNCAQLDEIIGISHGVQLIAHCRFADEEAKPIVKHYFRCLKLGVGATAQTILDRLNQFFEEHDLDWTKRKSITTDGAAAMQDSTNGVIRKSKTSHLIVFRIIA